MSASPLSRFASVLSLLAILATLSGCASDSSGEETAHTPPPPEIVAYTVSRADIPLSMALMGQTAGSREVEVRARVGGILLHRNYEEGSPVRQGDTLFEIDPEPYKAALEQARGSLGQAEASLAQAKRDAARMAALYKDKVVAKKDYDDALTTQDSATASVEAARGKVREAALNLEWTKVTAPISGLTSKETRSEGSLITTTSEGSLLTVVNRVDPLYVNFSMSGQEMLKLRREQAEGRVVIGDGGDFVVRLTMPDGSAYPEPGHINFTDTQVDASTGVVKVRAVFPNPQGTVLPGQFVRVHLEGARYKDAMVVPQGAVLNTQQGPMVWTVDDKNTIAPRPVTISDPVGNDYLVEKGLAPGERVVAEGVIKVRPGMVVRVRKPVEPEAKTADADAAKPQGAGTTSAAASANTKQTGTSASGEPRS